MTDSVAPNRAAVEAELDRVLGDTANHGLRVARDVVEAPDDRWYGQLVGGMYAALSDSTEEKEGAEESALAPAVAAIELLRGYTRLRSHLLVQPADERPHSRTPDPQQALLAGDYLYTSAFETLTSTPVLALDDGVEILTTAFGSITEAFARSHSTAASPESDQRSFLDQTLGSLGEAATLLGASLAGGPPVPRTRIAAFGRGAATAHGIDRLLESDPAAAVVVLTDVDGPELREHAARRRREAVDAQRALTSTAGSSRLRSLVPEARTNAP